MTFIASLLLASIVSTTPESPMDSATYKRVNLDEVIITEFKENRHSLTPTSISTANSQLLNTQEVTSLKELTAVMPNFFMPDYGSKQNSPVYIRGIGAKAKSPAIGFYVDGVPHFENSAFDMDMNDISDVEVYRGPQGTLYGRNAIGGIIAVHTHSPLDYQNTRVKLGYGSRNDVVAQFSNYTKLSDSFGFSVAGGFHHNDGFFRNHATNDKADAINSGMGRLSLVWKPARMWTMRLNSMLDYSDQNGYPYGKYDHDTKAVAPVDYNRTSTYRRLISTSGLNIRYDGERISFNSQTSYQFINDKQGIDQDFTKQDMVFVTNKIRQSMVSQDFTLKSNDDGRYQWIVGAFGMIQNINNKVEAQYLSRDYSNPTSYRIPVYAMAVYHQSSYNIWKGLSATVGLRFDYEYSKNDYRRDKRILSTNAITNERKLNPSLHFNQLTPKFTLQYLTTQNNLYYASVVRGYKAGGFNQTLQKDMEVSYNPEYNWNYEVGTKLNFLSGRLSTELSLFYIDWRHQQVARLVPLVGNIIQNAGHSDSKGLELGIAARPAKGWLMQLNYGYTYARFLNYKKSDKLDYSGNMLPMVPRQTLAMNGSYSFDPHSSIADRITVSAGLTGVGKIYWAEDNAVAQNFYALLNAKISVNKGIFTWELWGKNLTDTKYNTYWFKSTGEFAQKGRPANWGTSIVVNL